MLMWNTLPFHPPLFPFSFLLLPPLRPLYPRLASRMILNFWPSSTSQVLQLQVAAPTQDLMQAKSTQQLSYTPALGFSFNSSGFTLEGMSCMYRDLNLLYFVPRTYRFRGVLRKSNEWGGGIIIIIIIPVKPKPLHSKLGWMFFAPKRPKHYFTRL